jgi:hypothetical protein
MANNVFFVFEGGQSIEIDVSRIGAVAVKREGDACCDYKYTVVYHRYNGKWTTLYFDSEANARAAKKQLDDAIIAARRPVQVAEAVEMKR